MASSEINKLGVDLESTGVEVSASPSQAGVWSLGCDITIEDFDTDIQEIKVDDIALTGTISTNDVPVNIDYQKSGVYDLDVNVVIDGLNSQIIESQVITYEGILKITDFSPETTNEKRYAASARSVKILNDLASALGYSVKELFANYGDLKDIVELIKGKVDNMVDLDKMFYWYDKDKTIIGTKYHLFSEQTLASGGRASGTGGGNEGGGGGSGEGGGTGSGSGGGTGSGFIAMEKWDEFNPTLPQVLAAVLGIELHNRLTAVENGSVTPDLTPYATIAFVEGEINKLIGGADSAYDTLLEIQQILQGNEASIGTILDEIATKASKGELAALDNKYAKEVQSLKDKDAEIDKTLSDYKDRIEDLEDKESMFEWADEEHTIIKTRFDFYSEQTVASGGKGKQGQGTGSGGGVKAIAVNGKTIDDPNYDGIIELEDYPTKEEYDAKMASLDSNDEDHSRGIALNEQAIERIEPKVNQNVSDIKDIKIKDKEQDVRLDDAEKITKLFGIDDKGNLYTHKNFYSTGTVASGGAAKEGQGNSGATSGEYKMYTHVQGDPRQDWVINHGLNKVPNVKVIDSVNGEEVFGAMKVENMNVVTIRFGGAFSGTAYLD